VIVKGRIVDLIVLVLMFAVTYALMKSKWVPSIRKISAFDGIKEAIGRAVEMGRPVHMTPGTGSLNAMESGPGLIAGLATIGYAAEVCVSLKTRFIISLGSSDAIALADALLRQAFLSAGRPEEYDASIIRYYPGRDTIGSSLAFTNSVQGLIAREKPVANIMIGPFYGEQIALCEVAARQGAIQIGGTQSITQISIFAAMTDYAVIGEEIFAAGAYVSKDPIQLKMIAGGDFAKIAAVALIILGIVLKMLGVNLLPLLQV
jgi:hypothetical protein